MFSRKASKDHCHSCDRPLKADAKQCECGAATGLMTFEERTAWEVQQYRTYQSRTAATA